MQAMIRGDIAVLERLGVVAIALDLLGVIVAWTRAAEELGVTEHELGRPLWEIVSPGDREQVRDAIRDVVMRRSARRVDAAVASTTRRITWSCSYVSHDGVDSVIVWGTDASADVGRFRQQLKQATRELEAIYEHVPGILFYVAIEPGDGFRFASASRATLKAIGLRRDQFVGQLVRDVIPPASRDIVVSHYLEAIRTRQTVRWEEVSVYPAGRRVGEVAVSPLYDPDGAVSHLIGIVHDVTERKDAEDRLREENQRTTEFLATLSHELRNPLAAIRSALAILDLTTDDERRHHARAILERQVNHLGRVVDDLLDMARITSGKLTLRRDLLPLAELLQHTVDDYRPAFESRGVECEGRLMRDDPSWIDGDATRLLQVFSNLLGNALKFTPNGGRVTISLENDEGSAVVRVRDTGVGIAADVLDRVFVPFVQASQSLDRAAGGLGLGLALSKGLVDLHGGTMAAVSAGLGRGAELIVRLPLAPRPAPVEQQPAPLTTEPRRILVIEDNVDVAAALCMLLELRGHAVQASHDGPSAIAIAREFHPEIVICDLGLPGMSGYDVACALRNPELGTKPLLIAVSGYDALADRTRSAAAGFDHHFAKPLNLLELERLLAVTKHEVSAKPTRPTS
jgi:PAS domain S-box-containing protein